MPMIRCQAYQFQISDPFQAGHSLSEAEAIALNGLRAENIRNNLASQVAKATANLPAGTLLGQDELQTLAELAAKYDSEYEFGPKRRYTRQGPIEAEAKQIARARVVAAARQAGTTLSQDELIVQIERLAQADDVLVEARQRVQDSQQIASAALESLL